MDFHTIREVHNLFQEFVDVLSLSYHNLSGIPSKFGGIRFPNAKLVR